MSEEKCLSRNQWKYRIGTGKTPVVLSLIMLAIFGGLSICIQIKEQGFYFQTTPVNGTYYKYTDIEQCWEVERVYRHRRGADRQDRIPIPAMCSLSVS